jgi:hypothetical protein
VPWWVCLCEWMFCTPCCGAALCRVLYYGCRTLHVLTPHLLLSAGLLPLPCCAQELQLAGLRVLSAIAAGCAEGEVPGDVLLPPLLLDRLLQLAADPGTHVEVRTPPPPKHAPTASEQTQCCAFSLKLPAFSAHTCCFCSSSTQLHITSATDWLGAQSPVASIAAAAAVAVIAAAVICTNASSIMSATSVCAPCPLPHRHRRLCRSALQRCTLSATVPLMWAVGAATCASLHSWSCCTAWLRLHLQVPIRRVLLYQ